MDKKKVELGDVFEMRTQKGNIIYIQCVEIPKDIRNEVELIKVFYDLHQSRPSEINSITDGAFFTIDFH